MKNVFSSHLVFIPFRGSVVHVIFFPKHGIGMQRITGVGWWGGDHDVGSTSQCLSAIADGRWHRLSAQP